jgi:hypothetical protein
LGHLADEAELADSRYKARLAGEMSLLHLVVSTQPNEAVAPSALKKWQRALDQRLKSLVGGT